MLAFFLLTSFVLPYAASSSDGIDCGRVPPALWCRNAKLTAECGFSEHCERYLNASKNKPIQLTLIYESGCPGCQQFITEVLYPKIDKLGKYIDLELVPYGNTGRYENGTFYCQHGPDECVNDRFEGCAIKYLQDPLPFINCFQLALFNNTDRVPASAQCFKGSNVATEISQKILKCNATSEGDALREAAAKRTEDLVPEPHDFTPWLVFNNVSIKDGQDYRQDHLMSTVCEFYVGDAAPDFCEGLGFLAYASKKQE